MSTSLHSPSSTSSTQHHQQQQPEKLDLHDLVEQYKSHPDLLKLILTSKVEEDKRRAEEAKLKAKELDVYLHHQHHSCATKRRLSCLSSSSSSVVEDNRSIESMDQRRNSAAAAMVALASDDYTSPSSTTTTSPSSPPPSQTNYGSYPSPDSYYDEDVVERPRKRREMQAITKIVETREFPYQDNYFWKNNGNTTQKKTGCKSIYYKCSNSNKGCPVNKTVTARPNGEYLIKYRGLHLSECGRVERVCDL
ncbi:hypothetical protein RO3G_03909 [Lichtheimia corymbifera JMRC:FSU:9682]|uniref:WRKY domain-containing protein n=1 Tax=Lichtheimia corymbifera JMRC:FSU:9682 TaxID=1263082 RepID=A0A068RMJ6_9FUNG|nr:hypothetical protein RO3G_03909 [Lichtheimia corymbifera JMRC:FSU:9682]